MKLHTICSTFAVLATSGAYRPFGALEPVRGVDGWWFETEEHANHFVSCSRLTSQFVCSFRFCLYAFWIFWALKCHSLSSAKAKVQAAGGKILESPAWEATELTDAAWNCWHFTRCTACQNTECHDTLSLEKIWHDARSLMRDICMLWLWSSLDMSRRNKHLQTIQFWINLIYFRIIGTKTRTAEHLPLNVDPRLAKWQPWQGSPPDSLAGDFLAKHGFLPRCHPQSLLRIGKSAI